MQKTLLTLALLGTMGTAQAAHLEIGAGYSWGTRMANGFWVQNVNPHTIKLNSPTWYAGVTGHAYRYLAWHIDYVRLDTYGENSWDTADNHQQWTCATHTCYQFVGSGASQGVRLTLGPTFGYDGWHISAQGGPFLYESTWAFTVYDQSGRNIAQGSHRNRVQVGDVVGVSLRYRAFSLNADRYMMRAPRDRFPPLIYGATTLTAGYRF